MKRVILAACLSTALLPVTALAQLELPSPSPAAKAMQRVGLTDITVEYSSPAVKGRKVWGELVPYDKVWRTGANAATRITFSKDVTFGGKPVPAGTYSVVTFPTASGWTVALSKELTWFAGGKEYSDKDDVVRVPATTAEIPLRERMIFTFSNTTDDTTSLDLEWEKLRVSVPVKTETTPQVMANIKALTDNGWRPHVQAARWLAENTKEYDQALRYADASIMIQSTWLNNWTRADILSKKGKWADAKKAAQVAWDLGNKDPNFYMKDTVAKAMADWKSKK